MSHTSDSTESALFPSLSLCIILAGWRPWFAIYYVSLEKCQARFDNDLIVCYAKRKSKFDGMIACGASRSYTFLWLLLRPLQFWNFETSICFIISQAMIEFYYELRIGWKKHFLLSFIVKYIISSNTSNTVLFTRMDVVIHLFLPKLTNIHLLMLNEISRTCRHLVYSIGKNFSLKPLSQCWHHRCVTTYALSKAEPLHPLLHLTLGGPFNVSA